MKFSLLKLSAFALVAASMVSAEDSQPKLRGAKKSLPELRGAIQVGAKQDVALSAESSLDSSFFPDEMNEEGRNGNRIKRNFDDFSSSSLDNRNNRNNDYGNRKNNAAQKRQRQRDESRSNKNPNRSQPEEQRERDRKHAQARNRSDRCVDPLEPGCDGNEKSARNREAERNHRCNQEGTSCNYHRSSIKNEPNRRSAARDMDCIMDCDDNRSDRAREACERTCAAKKAKLAQE